ncbi:MAG: dihydrodipicolinate synthase family protein [Thermocrispum sp.]
MLTGTFPALPTFLNQDRSVDLNAQRAAVTRLIEAGVDGVVALGTSGEGMALDPERRAQVLRVCRHATERPLVAGCYGNSVRDAMERIAAAAKSGADAVMVPPPLYYPLPAASIVEFYGQLAKRSPLPIVLYHIPQLTKNHLDYDGFRELVTLEPVIGAKDSAGDTVFHLQIVALQHESFSVMQGQAPLLVTSYAAGAAGAITPISALFPGLELDLRKALAIGDQQAVRHLLTTLGKLATLLRSGGYPLVSNLKGIASLLGHGQPWTEPPIPTVPSTQLALLEKALQQLNLRA